MSKFRIVENTCQEERKLGYIWDVQLRHEVCGMVYWSPFVMFKNRTDAENYVKNLT